jgi:hypothetical protein
MAELTEERLHEIRASASFADQRGVTLSAAEALALVSACLTLVSINLRLNEMALGWARRRNGPDSIVAVERAVTLGECLHDLYELRKKGS